MKNIRAKHKDEMKVSVLVVVGNIVYYCDLVIQWFLRAEFAVANKQVQALHPQSCEFCFLFFPLSSFYIQALEERFKSCQKTCQGLQSYITSLYAKLEDSSSSRQSSSQNQHSTHIPWNSHNCGDKCHKSVSYVDFHHIGSSSSHHDQSHRHALRPIHAYESTPKDIHSKHDSALNPFTRSRSQASSVSSVSDSLKLSHSATAVTQDSGIERSNDVIARKNGALSRENNI